MINKFYLSEPDPEHGVCEFIGDDDLADAAYGCECVGSIRPASYYGVTRWIYLKPDVDHEEACAQLRAAIERRIEERRNEAIKLDAAIDAAINVARGDRQ